MDKVPTDAHIRNKPRRRAAGNRLSRAGRGPGGDGGFRSANDVPGGPQQPPHRAQ